jgi:hypothetical protein
MGRFREDLYFRLAAFPIRVPPLRERTEEIPTLALYFMENVGRKFALRFEGIGEADMKRLAEYPWPGNVRELEHVIERAALLSEPPRLRIPPLHEPFLGGATASSATEWIPLEEAERRYLRQVISHTHGRITDSGDPGHEGLHTHLAHREARAQGRPAARPGLAAVAARAGVPPRRRHRRDSAQVVRVSDAARRNERARRRARSALTRDCVQRRARSRWPAPCNLVGAQSTERKTS